MIRAEEKLERLANFLVQAADEMVPYLYEGEERANDWMDCGMADGTYETYLELLSLLGVEYEPFDGYGDRVRRPIEAANAEEKLQKLGEHVARSLKGLTSCLHGKRDRPDDLMDCGEIDGEYETLLGVAKVIGVRCRACKGYSPGFDAAQVLHDSSLDKRIADAVAISCVSEPQCAAEQDFVMD